MEMEYFVLWKEIWNIIQNSTEINRQKKYLYTGIRESKNCFAFAETIMLFSYCYIVIYSAKAAKNV